MFSMLQGEALVCQLLGAWPAELWPRSHPQLVPAWQWGGSSARCAALALRYGGTCTSGGLGPAPLSEHGQGEGTEFLLEPKEKLRSAFFLVL